MAALRVLILGGYGTFGGRLARLLADEERLTLDRRGALAERARGVLRGAARARRHWSPAAFDREGDVDAQLAALAPDIVVDASGPFQAYGDPYRVVRAAHRAPHRLSRSRRRLGFREAASRSSTRRRASTRRIRAFGRVELSGAHRSGDPPARPRNDARRHDQRRHRAVAFRRPRAQRHPVDRKLLRQADRRLCATAARPSRYGLTEIAALHHRTARPRAARQPAVLAGRCAGPAGAARAVARLARHLDGRRDGARNPASRAQPVRLGGAAAACCLRCCRSRA